MNESTNVEARRRGTRADSKTSPTKKSPPRKINHGDNNTGENWDDISLDENDKSKEDKLGSQKDFQIGLHLQLYCRRGLQLDTSNTGNVSMKAKLKSKRSMIVWLTFILLTGIMLYWRMQQFQMIEENSMLGSDLNNPLVIDDVPDHMNPLRIEPPPLVPERIYTLPMPKKKHLGPTPYDPLVEDATGLPNVRYGCGSTDRDVDEIQLHVIVWRRGTSTERLLNQLNNATYDGWDKPVNLYIHMDGGGSGWVKNICTKFEWKYGEKILDFRTENIGLRGIWLTSLEEASREAGDNTLMVVLEDDIRVSQHYFQGLLAMMDAYGRNRNCRDKNLMGFSLSPIKLEELRKPFQRWNAATALGERSDEENAHIAYLSIVPSSWGVAYWSDRWQEFENFCDHRIKPPFFDHQAEVMSARSKGDYDSYQLSPKELQIPDSRTNLWPKSWKRFLVDFMYGRGLVMLYPSLPHEEGFATTLALNGIHVLTKERNSENPRITTLIDDFELPETGALPSYGNLAVFGLHLEPTTREELAIQGAKFLHSVRDNCQLRDCPELLNHWARPETFVSKNTNAPQICVADLYMPASANAPTVANAIHLPPKQKYLLFEPQYGGTNQILATIEALYWASVLDRKLIVPPIFLPRVSEFELPFEEWPDTESVLQVGHLGVNGYFHHLRSNLPMPSKNTPIGFKEWMNSHGSTTTAVSRVLRVSRDAIFDIPERKLTKLMDTDGKVVTINLRHLFDNKAVSAETIQQYFGGCQDEVLAFENMFHVHIDGLQRYKVMSDVAALSEHANKVYSEVLSKLYDRLGSSQYTCFHVRVGDIKDMCFSNEISKIAAYHEMKKAGFACDVTAKQVKEAILSNGLPAFIMSDSTAIFKDIKSMLPSSQRFATSEWVREAILSVSGKLKKAELDLMSMVVEQELCKEATSAVLSKFSTVSGRVENLRNFEEVTYWKKHWMDNYSWLD